MNTDKDCLKQRFSRAGIRASESGVEQGEAQPEFSPRHLYCNSRSCSQAAENSRTGNLTAEMRRAQPGRAGNPKSETNPNCQEWGNGETGNRDVSLQAASNLDYSSTRSAKQIAFVRLLRLFAANRFSLCVVFAGRSLTPPPRRAALPIGMPGSPGDPSAARPAAG